MLEESMEMPPRSPMKVPPRKNLPRRPVTSEKSPRTFREREGRTYGKGEEEKGEKEEEEVEVEVEVEERRLRKKRIA